MIIINKCITFAIYRVLKFMEVSILVPIYNVEKFIEQCAKSLFEQTFDNIEYVFVDDCSTDNSVGVLLKTLEKYPQRKDSVHILRNEKNLGSGETRNVCLRNATGDYVMFVDSDDILPLNAVEKLHERAAKSVDVDIVEGAFQILNKGVWDKKQIPQRIYNRNAYIKLLLFQSCVNHAIWGKMYKRSLFTENNVWFVPNVNDNEDFCTNARVSYYSIKRTYISDVVYYYRIGDGNSSFLDKGNEQCKKNVLSACRAMSVVENFYENNDKKKKYRNALELGKIRILKTVVESSISIPIPQFLTPCSYNNSFIRIAAILYANKNIHRISYLYFRIIKRIYIIIIKTRTLFCH